LNLRHWRELGGATKGVPAENGPRRFRAARPIPITGQEV
jgi:hypothetical protein